MTSLYSPKNSYYDDSCEIRGMTYGREFGNGLSVLARRITGESRAFSTEHEALVWLADIPALPARVALPPPADPTLVNAEITSSAPIPITRRGRKVAA